MKKFNFSFKTKKIVLLSLLATGFIIFLAFTRQQAHSTTNLEMIQGADDDEPLSTSCGGVERWAVKVINDASWTNFDSIPKNATVTHLVNIATPTPSSTMPRYDAVEDSCYKTVVTIKEMRVESDSDWHLVITDGVSTMIAECPCPNCNSVIASHYIGDFTACRNWLAKNIGNVTNTSLNVTNVEITGQAFIDPPHGQTGAAPNNLELHSIIKIQFKVPTGVNTITDNGGINVYPNPSNGLFNVNFTQTVNARIRVFNMLGEEVYNGPVKTGTTEVNIVGKSAGLYLYDIISESGDLITSGKLLIR